MIFVSVGTHAQQFNRLLKEIDELAETGAIKESIFAQIGNSSYIPKNYSFKKFLAIEEFDKYIKKCNLFITHAGEGNIGTALQFEKKMIILPRRKKFGEHTNDHQLELAQAIKNEKQAIVLSSEKEIEKAIKNVNSLKIRKTLHAKGIISEIKSFMKKEGLE
jgi:UDP-N-acetylglucosamine transferase subunit ALG13